MSISSTMSILAIKIINIFLNLNIQGGSYSKLIVFLSNCYQKEISNEPDREAGRTKKIWSVPIYHTIYSTNGEIFKFSLEIELSICFHING